MNRIILYTHDLVPGRERLMPWLTLIEVARGAHQAGLEATVWSGSDQPDRTSWSSRGVSIIPSPKPRGASGRVLRFALDKAAPDLLFWPITWRESWRLPRLLRGAPAPVVAYLPGGCHGLPELLRALRWVSPQELRPFLLDALTPAGLLIRRLRAAGVRGLIAMTDRTRRRSLRAGWPADRAAALPPGREPEDSAVREDRSVWDRMAPEIREDPFFLYLGSAAPLRGGAVLLEAFQRLAGAHPDPRLVCLMRQDPGGRDEAFRRRLESLEHRSRVLVRWGNMTPGQILPFLSRSRAVVLPFLVIPSEVPVTYLEVLSHGVPVISTASGGTAELMAPGCLSAPSGNPAALADAMVRLLTEPDRVADLRRRGARLLEDHPTWPDQAAAWLEFARSVAARPWEGRG